MAEKTTNAERFLNAYASIERSLNQMLCKNDYVGFKKLVRLAAKSNSVVQRNEETLKEYADLRNAIVHQRSRMEEIIAEPLDSVTENIEHIADLLNADETVLAYSTSPVHTATETTTVKEAYEILHRIRGDKLPVYSKNGYEGLVTMDHIAGWMMEGNSSSDSVIKLLVTGKDRVIFVKRNMPIMEAVLSFEHVMNDMEDAPVILVTENGDMHEQPIGILSSHDLSRILAGLI